jgi:hypothetical protein
MTRYTTRVSLFWKTRGTYRYISFDGHPHIYWKSLLVSWRNDPCGLNADCERSWSITSKSCLACEHRVGQKKPCRYIAAGAARKIPLLQGSFQKVGLALATQELLTKTLLNIREDNMLCNCDPRRANITILIFVGSISLCLYYYMIRGKYTV